MVKMLRVPVTPLTPVHVLREVSHVVRNGGVIVYPTDTVYGLGCDPFNVNAVERIYRIKIRSNKPLPILASSLDDVEKIAILDRHALKIAKKFWPGPLTLILPQKRVLPDIITLGLSSVGVRIPGNTLTLQIIRASGGLLVGTSANITGEKPAFHGVEALKSMGGMVDLIIDQGPIGCNMPSTVVDLTTSPPKLLREGPISFSSIMEVYGN